MSQQHTNTFNKGMSILDPHFQSNEGFVFGLNGRLYSVDTKLAFSSIEGNTRITASTEFNTDVKEIVGHYSFGDEVILITISNTASTDYIWSLKESGSGFTFTKIWEGDLNLADNVKLVCVGVFENEKIKRVYFTDGINSFKKINVVYGDLSNVDPEELNVFQNATLEPISIMTPFEGGSLKVMNVGYVYRLVNYDGSYTNFSSSIKTISILNQFSTNNLSSNDVEGGLPGDDTFYGVDITINNIPFALFKKIEVFALVYEAKGAITSVIELGSYDLDSSSISLKHVGTEPVSTLVSASDILNDKFIFDKCDYIETKDNIMFAAGVSNNELPDVGFDSVAKSVNSSGDTYVGDFNTDHDTYKYVPDYQGQFIHGAESDGFASGNGIRFTFVGQEELLTVCNNGNKNLDLISARNPIVNRGLTVSTSVNSIKINPSNRGYQREEVYRFLIVFGDENNRDLFAQYCCDLKIPGNTVARKHLTTNLSNGNDIVVDNSSDADFPQFNVSNYSSGSLGTDGVMRGQSIYINVEVKLPLSITQRYKYYKIVRADRTEADRTIVDQGVVFPFTKKLKDNADPELELSFDQLPAGNYPAENGNPYLYDVDLACGDCFVLDNHYFYNIKSNSLDTDGTLIGSTHQIVPFLYSFDSPKVVSEIIDYKLSKELKFVKIRKTEVSTYYEGYIFETHPISDNGQFWFRHVGLKDVTGFSKTSYDVREMDKMLDNELVLGSRFNFDYPDIINIGVGSRGTLTNNFISLVPKNGVETVLIKTEYMLPTNWDFITYSLGSALEDFIKTSPHMDFNYATSTQDSDYSLNYFIVNLSREVLKQYGGQNYNAISSGQYIECSFTKITSGTAFYVDTVKNGDIYVDVFNHTKFNAASQPQDYGSEHKLMASSFSVVLETEIPTGVSKGRNFWRDVPTSVVKDEYAYNDAYESISPKRYIAQPINFEDITDFKNIIYSSNTKVRGSFYDDWSIFPSSNFYELDRDRGAITNIVKFKNELFALQSESGLARLYINSRALTPSNDGRDILIKKNIGDGGPIETHVYLSKYGCSFKKGFATSDYGFTYYSDLFGKIIKFDGGSVGVLSELKSIQKEFADDIITANVVDVSAYYDDKNAETVLSFFMEGGEVISISYSELYQAFNGYFKFAYPQYINFQDRVLPIHNLKEIWEQNTNEELSFNGVAQNFELEYIVNPAPTQSKIFDNFIGNIIVDRLPDAKFNKLEFRTNFVPQQEILQVDSRYRVREGLHLTPLREISGVPRMRGEYMFLKIIFENVIRKTIIASSRVSFRASKKS